jgi:hypothetical protein
MNTSTGVAPAPEPDPPNVSAIFGGLRNVEAEEAVLGAMLQDREAIKQVMEIVQPEDFSSVGREVLYRQLVRLYRSGGPIDLPIVGDELTQAGELDRVGGALELARLVERVPSAANIVSHANIVRDRSLRRRVIESSVLASEHARDMTRPIEATRAELRRAGERSAGAMKVKTRRAADVQARDVRWLWERRIPRATSTLLVGVPKVGKSLLTADIVARATHGSAWPDGTPNSAGPVSVLFLNVEDPVAEVQRPRLEAAGADLEKVHFVEGVTRAGADGALLLDGNGHLEALEEEIRKHGDVALVVLDPISAFFGHTNTWRDTDLRRVLSELAQVAERTDVAILAVGHFNKRSLKDGSLAIHRISGSGAFTAAARSILYVGRRAGEERSILASIGGNLSAPGPALAFSIVERVLQDRVGSDAARDRRRGASAAACCAAWASGP